MKLPVLLQALGVRRHVPAVRDSRGDYRDGRFRGLGATGGPGYHGGTGTGVVCRGHGIACLHDGLHLCRRIHQPVLDDSATQYCGYASRAGPANLVWADSKRGDGLVRSAVQFRQCDWHPSPL